MSNLDTEILGNPLAILESADILAVLKKHWIGNHENLTQPEKFVEEFFEWLKTSDVQKGHTMSNAEINKIYQKKLKEYKDASLDLGKPKDMFLEMIEQDLHGMETVLDFGCGKLTFLKNIAESNTYIRKLIGVDLKSSPILENLDSRIDFTRSLDSVANESVDLAIIKLVLHHLKNEQVALDIFKELGRILRPGGKLIIFEESFSDLTCKINEVKNYLSKFKLQISEATEDFLRLSEKDKINFLFINDWLMNLQNTYMPWTGLYESAEDWCRLVELAGFKKSEAHFLGAIKHRKRKQGMTVILKFNNIAHS